MTHGKQKGYSTATLPGEDLKRVVQLRQEIAERVVECSRIIDRALGRNPVTQPRAIYVRGVVTMGETAHNEPIFRLATEFGNLNDNINECERNGGWVESAADAEGDNHWGCVDPSTGTCHEIYLFRIYFQG